MPGLYYISNDYVFRFVSTKLLANITVSTVVTDAKDSSEEREFSKVS